MKKSMVFILMLASYLPISAQGTWTGTYEGMLDRDLLKLTLKTSGKNVISGTMTDSANKYDIEGTYTGNSFTGKAQEKNLGLIFDMVSILNGDKMSTTLSLDVFGKIEKMEISFTRSGSVGKTNQTATSEVKKAISFKKRDPLVVGLWVKESNYNSGYGFNDSYSSMSVSEKMEFLADGSMADGGSKTVVSGSNYSGSSSSGQKNIIDGLNWYTDGNKIFLIATQNGQTQTIELGKYFIENNNMLITGSNGEKLLLSKR